MWATVLRLKRHFGQAFAAPNEGASFETAPDHLVMIQLSLHCFSEHNWDGSVYQLYCSCIALARQNRSTAHPPLSLLFSLSPVSVRFSSMNSNEIRLWKISERKHSNIINTHHSFFPLTFIFCCQKSITQAMLYGQNGKLMFSLKNKQLIQSCVVWLIHVSCFRYWTYWSEFLISLKKIFLTEKESKPLLVSVHVSASICIVVKKKTQSDVC